MKPGKLNFEAQRKGNTFTEVTVNVIDAGVPVDFTGCEIVMDIKDTASAERILKRRKLTDGIVIVGPGEIKIESFLVDFIRGNHVYDLVVKFPNNTVTTYFEGFFPVIQNVSTL